MGLLGRLRANARQLRLAVGLLRDRGHGLGAALLRQLPAAVALRGYRKLVSPLNRGLGNAARFADFQDRLPAPALPRLYVIVMPHTLHFLLPCLALLRGRAQLVLLANGAMRWERQLLQRRLPEVPMTALRTLPLSSMAHGDVVSLLIEHQRGNFGIIDHDCYLFDDTVLDRLQPAADECLLALYEDHSERTGLTYPLTHFLYFNAKALRGIAQRYGVDARMTRQAPASTHTALARIGLGPRTYLKDYQQFHDTLHVLLALAYAERLRLRTLPLQGELPLAHIGGTSIGSHHTKNLFALYTHLRFLELVGDAEIARRYAHLTQPLQHWSDALVRRRGGDAAWSGQPVVDELMAPLQHALQKAWPDLGATSVAVARRPDGHNPDSGR